MDGVAHFGDNVIGTERDLGREGNFFEKLSVTGDGGDAEVGAAEVDSDGEIGHVRRRLSEARGVFDSNGEGGKGIKLQRC